MIHFSSIENDSFKLEGYWIKIFWNKKKIYSIRMSDTILRNWIHKKGKKRTRLDLENSFQVVTRLEITIIKFLLCMHEIRYYSEEFLGISNTSFISFKGFSELIYAIMLLCQISSLSYREGSIST